MNKQLWIGVVVIAGVLIPAGDASAQPAEKPKGAKFLYGLVLKSRKADEADFTDKTKRYGIEVFQDENNSNLVYLCETGAVWVMPAPGTRSPEPRPAKLLYGLVLLSRKANESDFTKDTKRYGVEVYRDENTGNIIFISETGALCVLPSLPQLPDRPREPKFAYGLVVQVRRADEPEFTDQTRKIGLESFKDESTKTLVYVSEVGAVWGMPAPDAIPPAPKGAKFNHGLSLQSRRFDETDFTDKTKKWGVEVYRDENTDKFLYISETGVFTYLAPQGTPPSTPKGGKFLHGLVLPSRRADEPDFTEKTKRYGVEVFRDENTGYTIYLGETGAIAVQAGK